MLSAARNSLWSILIDTKWYWNFLLPFILWRQIAPVSQLSHGHLSNVLLVSWLLDNLQSLFVVIFSLDGGQTTQGRKWYIILRLAPQMAKQITQRENIKHDLLFSALGNKRNFLWNEVAICCLWGRVEGVEYENMTRPGIFVLLHQAPGTVQSNMKTRQRIFYKFSPSWPGSRLQRSPELRPQTSSRIILAMAQRRIVQVGNTQMFSHKGSNFYRQNGIYFKVPWSDRKWNKWFPNMQIWIETFYSIPLTSTVWVSYPPFYTNSGPSQESIIKTVVLPQIRLNKKWRLLNFDNQSCEHMSNSALETFTSSLSNKSRKLC